MDPLRRPWRRMDLFGTNAHRRRMGALQFTTDQSLWDDVRVVLLRRRILLRLAYVILALRDHRALAEQHQLRQGRSLARRGRQSGGARSNEHIRSAPRSVRTLVGS